MKMPRTIRRHKAAFAIFAVAAALAACAGAAAVCGLPSAPDSDQAGEADDAAAQEQAEGRGDEGGDEAVSDIWEGVDRDRYASEVRSYGTTSRELQDFLDASVWVNGDSYARFEDGAVVTKKSGKDAQAAPFVVKSSEKKTETADAAKTSTTTYIAAIEVDGQPGLLTYTRAASTAVDFDMSTSKIVCTALFGNSSEYASQGPAETFDVANLSSDAVKMLGGDKDKIASALSTLARDIAPTASIATWNEDVTIDYGTGIASATFTLNNSSKTTVKAKYDMGSNRVFATQSNGTNG